MDIKKTIFRIGEAIETAREKLSYFAKLDPFGQKDLHYWTGYNAGLKYALVTIENTNGEYYGQKNTCSNKKKELFLNKKGFCL